MESTRKTVISATAIAMNTVELVIDASTPPTSSGTSRLMANCSSGLWPSAKIDPRPQWPPGLHARAEPFLSLRSPPAVAVRGLILARRVLGLGAPHLARRPEDVQDAGGRSQEEEQDQEQRQGSQPCVQGPAEDRKSTRLNSSHKCE